MQILLFLFDSKARISFDSNAGIMTRSELSSFSKFFSSDFPVQIFAVVTCEANFGITITLNVGTMVIGNGIGNYIVQRLFDPAVVVQDRSKWVGEA